LPEADHVNALNVSRRIKKIIGSYNVSEIAGPNNAVENPIDKFSISIGIASYPFPNNIENYEELIALADEAMYMSKKTRTGNIYGYNNDCELVKLD